MSRFAAIACGLTGLSFFWGCATVPSSQPSRVNAESRKVLSADFDTSGERLWFVSKKDDVCSLNKLEMATRKEAVVKNLDFCPIRLKILGDSTLLLTGGSESSVLLDGGGENEIDRGIIDAIDRTNMVRTRGDSLVWLHDETEATLPKTLLEPFRILPASKALLAVTHSTEGDSLVRWNGTDDMVALAGPFKWIDSFDVSPDEKELVISADRGNGFDVAIGSTETATLRWLGTEPLAETMVSWAPRGNKVTYLLGAGDGPILRTVHVPTGFQVAYEVLCGDVQGLTWEPKAERFALLLSSCDASSRVEWVRYAGEERATLVASDLTHATEVERLPNSSRLEAVFPPRPIRYGQRYPLVVWAGVNQPFAWSDSRAMLAKEFALGTIVTSRNDAELDEGFWTAVLGYPWIDSQRIYVVTQGPLSSMIADKAAALNLTVIVPAPASESTARETKQGKATIVALPTQGRRSDWSAAEHIAARLGSATPANGIR